MSEKIVTITGAFSYTGKYATRLLLDRGYRVRTLTNHPTRPNPFGDAVEVHPYNFDHPSELEQSLAGTSTLINTYWVRFPHRGLTYDAAVTNTQTLISAAERAGVQRIVHVSIANPILDSPLGYYRGKALLEKAIANSGLSYAILRPTVIYGTEDILINNIAWFIRRFPIFGIPGDGRYSIRPIYVEDMARAIVNSVDQNDNTTFNAVGPETFSFEQLIRLIAEKLGRRVRLVHTPTTLAYIATRITGLFVGDTILTRQEYQGLMSNLLAPEGPSVGQTRLTQWLDENRDHVGAHYASELARHFRT